jgi:hypothetical protein
MERSLAWLGALALLAAASLSGAVRADPRTPPAAVGMPKPFLGTAVLGSGALTAAVDAYGQIVDIRHPGPAGEAQLRNPFGRQRFGTVEPGTGLSFRVHVGGRLLPPWGGRRYTQRYLPRTNVLRTAIRIGDARVVITDAIHSRRPVLVRRIRVDDPSAVRIEWRLGRTSRDLRCQERRGSELICSFEDRPPSAESVFAAAARADRRWLARATPLGPGAPAWARQMYERSLLVLRALTDRRSGALAAGPRDGWAYVWPRDAAAGAIALASAGYVDEARRVAAFLAGLDLDEGARFDAAGRAVHHDGRTRAGDSPGWVAAAGRETGLDLGLAAAGIDWASRNDYAERDGDAGAYLANAIASGIPADELQSRFATRRGLVRRSGDAASGLDSTAAWTMAPFGRSELREPARRTLVRLAIQAGRFGITPTERWPGADPWTASTAWTVLGLAKLGEEALADRLLGALRRAATPAGTLPERVDVATGIAHSTTPLAWSHAFAILALRTRY